MHLAGTVPDEGHFQAGVSPGSPVGFTRSPAAHARPPALLDLEAWSVGGHERVRASSGTRPGSDRKPIMRCLRRNRAGAAWADTASNGWPAGFETVRPYHRIADCNPSWGVHDRMRRWERAGIG